MIDSSLLYLFSSRVRRTRQHTLSGETILSWRVRRT